MEYISQEVAICSLWTVCPCFYMFHITLHKPLFSTKRTYLHSKIYIKFLLNNTKFELFPYNSFVQSGSSLQVVAS